jgi:large subunit ribosomal protein L15
LLRQNSIAPAQGSRKASKRVGRGNGSGHGTYSGRGCKGQKARAGNNKVRPGFEGGQLPLIKRLPRKRGFTNIFKIEYSTVNLGDLNKFEAGTEVTSQTLLAAGIIKSKSRPVKILADGDIDRALTVKAHKFSAAARAKIEAAGGKAEEVTHATAAE